MVLSRPRNNVIHHENQAKNGLEYGTKHKEVATHK